jgi:hypothetical protein
LLTLGYWIVLVASVAIQSLRLTGALGAPE